MEHLFVYGTLLKDFKSDILDPIRSFLKFESKGYLKGKLYDLGEYPAVIEDAKTQEKVTGEVYSLENPEKVFDVLDEYEGINDKNPEYERKRKIVTLGAGRNIKSWVYIYKKPLGSELKKIGGGDYLKFLKNKANG